MNKRSKVVKRKVEFDGAVRTTAGTWRLLPLGFAAALRFFLMHMRKMVEIYCI